ncbi:MAG: hypothetical protein CSB33_03010 [Desulfobacterales bacterium]|nr:MAG: hypothetical protein CSB33_03010 [Desulfobacterales bacterium]
MITTGVSCALFPGLVQAETPVLLYPSRQFSLAERYARQGRHDQAAMEYERFAALFPEKKRTEEARIRAGESWFAAGDMERAKAAADALMDAAISGGDWEPEIPETGDLLKPEAAAGAILAYPASRAWLLFSRCQEAGKETGPAVRTLQELGQVLSAQSFPETPAVHEALRDEIHWRMAWVWLRSHQWERAHLLFSVISPEGHRGQDAARIMRRLGDAAAAPRKDPVTAGVLSIIPGLGQVYCERYQDAFISFLLNGLLGAAAVRSFEQDNPALGGVISLVGIGFYGGNIVGARGSAVKYNDRADEEFLRQIRAEKDARLSFCPREDGGMIMYSLHF